MSEVTLYDIVAWGSGLQHRARFTWGERFMMRAVHRELES
jgi:hypothetical protein